MKSVAMDVVGWGVGGGREGGGRETLQDTMRPPVLWAKYLQEQVLIIGLSAEKSDQC